MSKNATAGNESDGAECPTCGKVCASEHGLRIHHSTKHNIPLESDEVLLDELRKLGRELGRCPTQPEMNTLGPRSTMPYTRQFGTWNNALRKAGFEVNREKGVSKERRLEYLREFAEEIGRVPRKADMDQFGKYGGDTYHVQFDGWNNALKQAGFEVNEERDIAKEDLIERLQDLAEKLGSVPTRFEMNAFGEHDRKTYKRHFGSWPAALDEAGLKDDPDLPESNHVFDEYNYSTYYGTIWRTQRLKALDRDDECCRACTMGLEEHIEKFGRSLNVHHIRPAVKFGKPTEENRRRAHDLDNLLTLCDDCHPKWEGIPLKPER